MQFCFFTVSSDSDDELLPDQSISTGYEDADECADDDTTSTYSTDSIDVHNWQDPSGNLFEFSCNKTNVTKVTRNCFNKLNNYEPISFFFPVH